MFAHRLISDSFPSPVGELHFSMGDLKDATGLSYGTISVPCRGTTFLNQIPQGYASGNAVFPSPVGELHFSIISFSSYYLSNLISVPCRGTTFLNDLHAGSSGSVQHISVPCRGTTFLNTIPTIPPPVWAHGRDCVGKIFLEKQIKFIRLNRQQTQYLSHARQNPNRYSLLLRNINFTLSHHIFFPLIAGTFQNMW